MINKFVFFGISDVERSAMARKQYFIIKKILN